MTDKFEIAVKTSGVNLGVYEGADADEAIEAMSRDAGYESFSDQCAASDPADLGAEIERQRADLIVTRV